MKTTLIALCIFAMTTTLAHGQSAVYVCGNTGAIGWSWAGSASGMDRLHLEMTALEECRKNGGTKCELLEYVNTNNIYVAVVIGMDERYVYQIIFTSKISAADAESLAKQDYRDANYPYPEYARTYSWYVPQ